MGGDYYDRPVVKTKSRYGYSKQTNQQLRVTREIQKSLDPKRSQKLICNHKNPIVFALDVTGSMGNWCKIIYDKLPMFFGQILFNSYLKDPALSFCAIGDAYTDKAPLQVADFGQGKEIDQLVSKIYLEGDGGGQDYETYELGAYFYNSNRCDISKADVPFFFFTGDEMFYPNVKPEHISEIIGMKCSSKDEIDSVKVFKDLKKKFKDNVFLIHKKFKDGLKLEDEDVVKGWSEAIGRHNIIEIKDAKSIIDVVLGVIAIVTRERSLQTYVDDMKNRGQQDDRISVVKESLLNLSKRYKAKNVNDTLKFNNPTNPTDTTDIKDIKASSYGIIPVRFVNDKPEVFLLQHRNGEHWDFSKGRAEENEDDKTCAERELYEESKLQVDEYLTDEVLTTYYEIKKWTGYIIRKTVYYRIATVSGHFKVEKKEIIQGKWFSISEALKIITFDESKELLKKSIRYMKKPLF